MRQFLAVFKIALIAFGLAAVSSELVWAASDEPELEIVAEYPRGRFQETRAPNLFKWSASAGLSTITISVYKTNDAGEYDEKKNFVGRFDLTGDRRSLTWTELPFEPGSYKWVAEAFVSSKAAPVSRDTAAFQIDELRYFNSDTSSVGLMLGTSLGSYSSTTADTQLSFSTTPIIFGLRVGGGNRRALWEVRAIHTDFVLKGTLNETFDVMTGYYWRINREPWAGWDLHAGPLLMAYQFSSVSSTDGETLNHEAIGTLMSGVQLRLHRQVDEHISFFAHGNLLTPFTATKPLTGGLKDRFSTLVGLGMRYSLFWPLAFEGRLSYRMDRNSIETAGQSTVIESKGTNLVVSVVYGF